MANSDILSSTSSLIFGESNSVVSESQKLVHAEGRDLSVDADYSVALGRNVRIPFENDFSFVFNTTEELASP